MGPVKRAASKGRPRHSNHEGRLRIRELVPRTVCGPRTSVERVFRVEARVGETSQVHLVFLDRHGWYCEHGRACPAVAEVRKRGAGVYRTQLDWTNNGRMRR